MRNALLISVMCLLVACGQAQSQVKNQEQSQGENQAQNQSEIQIPEPNIEKPDEPSRLAPPTILPSKLECKGIPKQGGLVTCFAAPYAKIRVSRGGDDYFTPTADANGELLVGFDRDEKHAEIILDGDPTSKIVYDFTPRQYDVSKIDGLPPSKVSTFTEAQLVHIRAATKRKKIGFASREKTMGFKDGFTSPIKTFRKTTNFGARRILNGEPKKPHYGVDMAAPVGTPIFAPADGVVSLADNDMYFEGQMVMVDHGQGLNSIYLHMSEIDVKAGQAVKRGDQLGLVGTTGRSTGPHLCWRLKWRNRNLDPELLTHWPPQP